ncbi:hypothetical protein EMIT043CA1_80085 [Pseudomonas brassicacearum]
MARSWLGPQQVEKQEQASIASAIEGANLRKINLSPYSTYSKAYRATSTEKGTHSAPASRADYLCNQVGRCQS